MWPILWAFVGSLRPAFRAQGDLALENPEPRWQIDVLTRGRGGRRLCVSGWARAPRAEEATIKNDWDALRHFEEDV